MKYLICSAFLSIFLVPVADREYYLIVGTYDSAKSEGVYVYRFNADDASVKEISHVKSSNPSFVAVSPDERFVYAVNENAKDGDGGGVSAFQFDKANGVLTDLSRQRSGGDHPCYVTVDKTGKWVIAGNYTSGTLSVLRVNPDGSIGQLDTTIRHTGKGKDPDRQESSHVHCTFLSPENNTLFVPDLGLDKVMIYSFDTLTGKLKTGKQPFVKSIPGAGPRHITFHPSHKFAYLIEELSGTVQAFRYKNGRLTTIQRISSLPKKDTSSPGSADIHVSPDGKFLYASNRGTSNTIAIYRINELTGKLAVAGFQSALGKAPRNFSIDPSGNFMLVGNMDSDEIVIFKIDHVSGKLTDTGKRISVGKPVCLQWINTK